MGHGYVVARWCMVRAGRVRGNVMGGGPQRPCGSIAKARRIMLAMSRSWMMVSPSMVRVVFVVGFVITCLSRIYLPFSNVCRCLSAAAVKRC